MYKINGEFFNPIKMGDPDDWYEGSDNCGVCPDWGTHMGDQHLDGCDLERCPKCKGQLISCDCVIVKEVEVYNEEVCDNILQ